VLCFYYQDMLKQWLGRNGVNGKGGSFPAWAGHAETNAFSNGRTPSGEPSC
jgi:hypothetical protein